MKIDEIHGNKDNQYSHIQDVRKWVKEHGNVIYSGPELKLPKWLRTNK